MLGGLWMADRRLLAKFLIYWPNIKKPRFSHRIEAFFLEKQGILRGILVTSMENNNKDKLDSIERRVSNGAA